MDLAEKLPKWTYLAHQTTQWARTVLCHCCGWKAAEGWFQGLLSPPKTVLHPWLISDSEVNWIINRPFHASRIYTAVFYRRSVVQSAAHMGWAVEWWRNGDCSNSYIQLIKKQYEHKSVWRPALVAFLAYMWLMGKSITWCQKVNDQQLS